MNYYNEIKNELVNNEINRKVKNYSINKSDLNAYYNVGRMLSEAGNHYGEGIIEEYSKRLTYELGKGYSKRNLWLMLKFYELNEKVQTLSAQIHDPGKSQQILPCTSDYERNIPCSSEKRPEYLWLGYL